MKIKFIKEEDFVNYKQPCMFIGMINCDFKCCKEAGVPISTCQNEPWINEPVQDVNVPKLIVRYLNNNITHAIVFGGLEPFLQYDEIKDFIRTLREDYKCNDDIIIYTGYYRNEILSMVEELSSWENIYIKFGRYIPHNSSKYDKVLGVTLASSNQYGEKIS